MYPLNNRLQNGWAINIAYKNLNKKQGMQMQLFVMKYTIQYAINMTSIVAYAVINLLILQHKTWNFRRSFQDKLNPPV